MQFFLRSQIILLVAASGLFFGSPLQAAERAEQASSPNIILILTDDHGWSQLSQPMDPRVPASASQYLETPNMNRLANGGMRFTSGYSPAPLCTPTRRSILCGAATARCGTTKNSRLAVHVYTERSRTAVVARLTRTLTEGRASNEW